MVLLSVVKNATTKNAFKIQNLRGDTMVRKSSMMGSSKYELDPNGLDRDVLLRQEEFKFLYRGIYEKVMASAKINQQVLSANGVHATRESFLDEVLRQLILDIRVGRFLATEEEFNDL